MEWNRVWGRAQARAFWASLDHDASSLKARDAAAIRAPRLFRQLGASRAT